MEASLARAGFSVAFPVLDVRLDSFLTSNCMNLRDCCSATRRHSRGVNQSNLASQFQSIREGFPSPEDIDDSRATAPSKRVLQFCPSYRKVLNGTQAAAEVGIDAMRRECPHFRDWLGRLEQLGA